METTNPTKGASSAEAPKLRKDAPTELARQISVAGTLILSDPDFSKILERRVTAVLVRAIAEGDRETVEALARSGANLNGKTGSEGITPLIAATQSDNIELFDLLILYGADPTIKDDCNATIATYAEIHDSTAIKARLKNFSAKNAEEGASSI